MPVCTLPKLRLDGFAVRDPGVTPVPDNGMLSVGLEALLVSERVPPAAPADCGANTTLKLGLLWLGAKVKGRFKPFTANPLLVTAACVMVTLEPPELVRVSVRVWLLPVCTLLKLSAVGVDDSEPGPVPEPESGTFRVEFEALLANAMLPLAAPAASGAKVTLKLVL